MSGTINTPSPWVAVVAPHGPIDIFDANGRDFITLYGRDLATARLIAAAPDLLPIVAVIASLPIGDATADDVPLYGLDGVYITHGIIRAARAAIAKAEGRE